MLVHTGSLLTVTLARLDDDANARQPTEFKFMLLDHSDEAFLELAVAVREHKAEIAASFDEGRQGLPKVIEGEIVGPVADVRKPRVRKAAPKK